MARKNDDQSAIRRYLLGQLSDAEQQEVEHRLLTDDEFFEELEIVEDELIDDYLESRLSADERLRFESYFLASPERQEQLASAKALKRYFAKADSLRPPNSFASRWNWLQKSFFSTPIAVAATLLIVAGLAFLVWRGVFYESDADKALVALNNAYKQQRPVEARITKLGYAPMVSTRGPGGSVVDKNELTRAQALLLQQIHNNPTPAAHHALGRVFLTTKEFDRAIEEFQEALKGDPNNAQSYADLGAAYLEKGKTEIDSAGSDQKNVDGGKGLQLLGYALENLNKALDLNANLLEALFNRALCKQRLTLYAQAEEDWRLYLQKDPNSPWAEEARHNLKLLEERKTNSSQSDEGLQQNFLNAFGRRDDEHAWKALTLSRRRSGNAIIENQLDRYLDLRIKGDLDDANTTLQRIVYAGDVELRKSGDRYTSDLAEFYGSANLANIQRLAAAREQMTLANASFNKGEFEKAIELYTVAQRSFAALVDAPEKSFAEIWIGSALRRSPRPEESIRIFESLSNELELKHYESLLVFSLNALCDARISRNEFSRALEYADRSLLLSERIQDYSNVVRSLASQVTINLTLNNYNQSLESLRLALNIASTIPPEPKLMFPLYHDGALNFHLLNLPGPAVAFEQEALRLATLSGVPLLKSRAWERLGIIYGQEKDFAKAIESGENALAEAENISGELTKKNVSARSMLILGQLSREAGNFRESIDYFDRSLELYRQLEFEAYSYQAHKGKLQALISLHETDAAATELRIVLNLFETQRTKIFEESNRDRFFDAGQDTYDIAIEFAHSIRNDEQQAFEFAELSRARSLFEIMNTGAHLVERNNGPEIELHSRITSFSLPEIQRRMPEESQLLEYAVLDDKVLMWVVTRSSITSAKTDISAVELDKAVHDYVELAAHGASDSEAFSRQARRLYQTLISPVEGVLNKDLQLCIIADKSLNYLPFAALVSESSGRYLLEDYKIEHSPSATVFVRCSEEARNRIVAKQEDLLSVGNPQFDRSAFPSLGDLPSAAREAKEIASFYKSDTTLIGTDATFERVARAIRSADVVHLAMHAVSDESSTLDSRLLLAGDRPIKKSDQTDGALPVSEIYRLSIPRTRLVVLSACQTGIEHAYKGEGAVGLARPFIAAGVPLVVATLWPVESNATADLMIRFHRHRKQDNISTVEALRLAQLESLRNRQPGSQIGNDWAAFVVIGGYAGF